MDSISKPEACCQELQGTEEVVGEFVEAGRDAARVFASAEKPFEIVQSAAVVGRRMGLLMLGQIAPDAPVRRMKKLPFSACRFTIRERPRPARQQRRNDRPLPIDQIEPSDLGQLRATLI